jgi:hypothetical protein
VAARHRHPGQRRRYSGQTQPEKILNVEHVHCREQSRCPVCARSVPARPFFIGESGGVRSHTAGPRPRRRRAGGASVDRFLCRHIVNQSPRI